MGPTQLSVRDTTSPSPVGQTPPTAREQGAGQEDPTLPTGRGARGSPRGASTPSGTWRRAPGQTDGLVRIDSVIYLIYNIPRFHVMVII